MDVFDVHRKLIDDYREFTTAFVDILDSRVKEHVDQELDRGTGASPRGSGLRADFVIKIATSKERRTDSNYAAR